MLTTSFVIIAYVHNRDKRELDAKITMRFLSFEVHYHEEQWHGGSESESSSNSQKLLICDCRSNTSNIPYVEFESIVHEGFNIEALGRHDMRYIFI